MREIKFSGKRKDNGEWMKGAYRKYKNRHQIGLNVSNEGFYWQWFNVIPGSVAQYTGLDDKNDREIYGHHIIKVTEVYDDEIREHITDIEWTEASFVAKDCGKDYYSTFLAAWFNLDYPLVELEIIGNKCDNPELLEV